MPLSGDNLSRSAASPLRTFLSVLFLVFSVELVIMLEIMPQIPLPDGSLIRSMLDASILTIVLAPCVWLLVVRPLRLLSMQRGRLLSRHFDIQEAERIRLSRDLHDELGQQLTAVLLGVKAVEAAADLEQARARSKTLATIAAGAMDSVRRLARGLRPAVLTDLGLKASVQGLCESISSSSGLEVELDFALESERLEPQMEVTVYRVIQEALTNVVRHAGATRASVSARNEGRDLVIKVSDDGKGQDAARRGRGGLGIQGMRERVSLLDGEMKIDWARQGKPGTDVLIRIPEV